MPDYRALTEPDKKAVRKLVDDELERFRAKVSSVDSRGRFRAQTAAQVPDWTPADLARAAMQARQ